jgi:hypothetical protein
VGIQVRRTGSSDYGHYIKALIAGEPGAGKTLISSTFPNVLYASAEGGLMSVSDRDVALVDIKNSADLLELKSNLDQKASVREKFFGGPIDTVVIDTIDEVARILQKERTTETKKETLAMNDWGWFGDQLRGIIRRYLQTFPDARHPWIKDRSGKLPMEFPVNFEDDYKRLDHLIYGNVTEQVERERVAAAESTASLAAELAQEAPKVVEPVQEKDQTPEPAAEPEKSLEQKMAEEDAKAEVAIAPSPAAVVDEPVVAQEPIVTAPEPTEPFTTPHEDSIPAPGTETAAADPMACQGCGGQVENQDQVDLSQMRFRETLCRSCFVAKKKK